MEKITEIRIRNFQSIGKSNLVLSPNVNAIVGESDLGKSAILRALQALATNPSGVSNIREGASSADVSIHLTNGIRIDWHKEKTGSASYRVTIPNNKAEGGYTVEEFNRIGREIPDKVKEVLPFKMVDVLGDKHNLNFANQFDSAFLLSFRPSVRSRFLDSLTGLDLLHSGLKMCNKDARQYSSDNNVYEKEIVKSEEQLKDLEWVKPIGEKVGELRASLKKSEQIQEKLESLKELNKNLEVTQVTVEALATRLSVIDTHIPEANTVLKKVHSLYDTLSSLKTLREDIASCTRSITSYLTMTNVIADKLKNVDIDAVYSTYANYLKLKELRVKSDVKGVVAEIKKKKLDVEAKILQSNKELEKFVCDQDMCPLCGLELLERCKKGIVKR